MSGWQTHQGSVSDVSCKTGFVEEKTEAHFAQLLDEAGIAYEYEPARFHVGMMSHEGKVKNRAFQPDFYLPELDMYVELTTSNIRSRNYQLKMGKIRRLGYKQPALKFCLLGGEVLERMMANGGFQGRQNIETWLWGRYRRTAQAAGIAPQSELVAA